MPHATLARAPAGSSTISVFVLKDEIDFGAPDSAKVDICFFTMGPPADRQTHLEILSELSRMALNAQFLDSLRASTTSEELYSRISEFAK